MNKEIDDIIKNKNYHDLSGDELRLIEKNGISKNEFINLKLFFQQLEIEKQEKMESLENVKGKLDQLFEEKHAKKKLFFWNNDKPIFNQPLLQVAAIMILVFVVFRMTNFEAEQKIAQITPEKEGVVEEKELSERLFDDSSDKKEEVIQKKVGKLEVKKEKVITEETINYKKREKDISDEFLIANQIVPKLMSMEEPEIVVEKNGVEIDSQKNLTFSTDQSHSNLQYSSQPLDAPVAKSDFRLNLDTKVFSEKNEELALITPLF